MAVPMMPPVSADGGAGDSTDGCTATAAYRASDDGTAQSLRLCICHGYCRQQRQQKKILQYPTHLSLLGFLLLPRDSWLGLIRPIQCKG